MARRFTCGDEVEVGAVSSVTAPPVVDLRDDPGQLRWKLRESAHEVGFFYLTGHGVPEALTRPLLDAAHRLFALPRARRWPAPSCGTGRPRWAARPMRSTTYLPGPGPL